VGEKIVLERIGHKKCMWVLIGFSRPRKYINLKEFCKFSDNTKEIKYFNKISDYQLVKNCSWTIILTFTSQ
jgi:hypothetical protein